MTDDGPLVHDQKVYSAAARLEAAAFVVSRQERVVRDVLIAVSGSDIPSMQVQRVAGLAVELAEIGGKMRGIADRLRRLSAMTDADPPAEERDSLDDINDESVRRARRDAARSRGDEGP